MLPVKGVAPLVMCLLAPISTGRSQPQKEGRTYSGSELIYLQRFQSKMNVAIFYFFLFLFFMKLPICNREKKKPFSYPLNSWKQEDAVCFSQDGNSALFNKGGIRSPGILLAITRVGDRESCPAMLRAGDKHLDTPGGQEPVQRSWVSSGCHQGTMEVHLGGRWRKSAQVDFVCISSSHPVTDLLCGKSVVTP